MATGCPNKSYCIPSIQFEEEKAKERNEPSPLHEDTNSPRENLLEPEHKHPSQLARVDTVTGFYKPSPTIEEAFLAFNDIKKILRPPKTTGGYKDPELDSVFRR
ncbi:uncharacterized protein F5147DRAFT_770078 [Suillus discolor]|uniref:Uncharacterized protein n=1 Tax=Suillus discolor TaxID=1912936 RepID=A0A9P7JXT5_9AGAM|nr:uncharacterized protein F5147DRAFT_770078 [Suillus discolor]KAG2114763.1 hypothetical protein F5147DRAFT_770078 [Suillus discolor]